MAEGKKRHSIKEYFASNGADGLANGTSVLLTPETTPTKSSQNSSIDQLPVPHNKSSLTRSLSDSLLESPRLPIKVTKCEKHVSNGCKAKDALDFSKTSTRAAKSRKSRAKQPGAKAKAAKNKDTDSENTVEKRDVRSSSVPGDRKKPTLVTDYFPVRRSSRVPSKDLKSQKQSDIEEKIMAGCEDGLEVVPFVGKGRGVIATKSFKRGDFVVEYVGDTIDLTTAKQRELTYTDNPEYGCYMYYFKFRNQSYCVDATAESNKLGRLLNHSKANKNCATKVVGIDNKPYLILVAIRDISPGEELLYDYGDRSKSSLEAHPWLAL